MFKPEMREAAPRLKLPVLSERSSGVLLHPTSLPGPHGNGDLGPEARAFIDFLQRAGQRWWQMLPVGPCGFGNSPYSSLSAFAGNPLLLSLDALVDEGLLTSVPQRTRLRQDRVDYQAAARFRDQHVRAAFDRFQSRKKGWDRFQSFRAGNAAWLPDFSLYTALKRAHGGVQWTLWPTPLRARRPKALAEARRQLADELQFHAFEQWQFARQWDALRKYAESRGVALIGDLPIFVAHDSADVWAHPELFQLDAEGMPTVVSGVPPDYFSATGQRWGNPLYRWPLLKRRGYAWWIERMQKALERFSAVRLDHFIGFQRYWEIPAACPTAEDGKWMPGPGDSLFQALRRALGPLPLIAEDLGAITPAVKALRDRFELPGIRILQFAFGTDPSAPDFKPHNYPRRAVVYTGTHDNDTTVSWFEQRNHDERNQALAYLGARGDEIHWDLIRAALSSVADLAVVPMQDLLGLGAEARMNLPGTAVGNWAWRVSKRALSPALADRLGAMTRMYDR